MTDRTDARLKRDPAADRRDDRMDDRLAVEDRGVTDADRLEMFRQNMFTDALPNIPAIPGYHVCWLTTTNPRDSITQRIRLGYELIRAEEIPGMEFASLKTGEYAGCIGVEEMVAARLPDTLYQMYMRENHHIAPRGEEEALTAKADALKADAERDGGNIIEDEGFGDLRRPTAAPATFQ